MLSCFGRSVTWVHSITVILQVLGCIGFLGFYTGLPWVLCCLRCFFKIKELNPWVQCYLGCSVTLGAFYGSVASGAGLDWVLCFLGIFSILCLPWVLGCCVACSAFLYQSAWC